jgi:cell division protein FtsW
MAVGTILVSAASPAVAERINLDPFYFVRRQQVFLVAGLLVMLALSMFSPVMIRRFAMLGLAGSLLLMMLLPLIGMDSKGATRWIYLGGLTLQPSEFMKPFFAIVTAWLFSRRQEMRDFPAYRLSISLYAITLLLLVIQPDFGMAVTLTVIWGVQLFLAGLPYFLVFGLMIIGTAGVVGAYFGLSHVRSRIDRFLDPESGDNYQVDRSIEAFQNGGLLGRGPGEGQVKLNLPDSHTDFIFAVAGEEFGLFFCLIIVAIFLFIILQGFNRIREEKDHFIIISVAGILTMFAVQALINMGVAVQMLPAKGMTLPFLSYGGSSVMAMAMAMGAVLALTRRRFNQAQ